MLCIDCSAASKARLIYGKDWSRAGREVRKTLESPAFKSATKGRYVVEVVDEALKPSELNLGTLKLPAIFLVSEAGNCYCVLDNVPSDTPAAKFAEIFSRADRIRTEYEKSGWTTADECGEFLQRMERYVGGPRRVISKGFYDNVFAKLKSLDPSDSTGWIRHFTLGEEFDKSTKADGMELVIKANEYREKGDFSGGESFISGEMKKPRAHLSKEQIQGVLMAKFALYREDASKTDEMNKILEKVAAYDETTLWGTAALVWLNKRKAPPLSAYWGWRKGDFQGRFQQTVKYGVGNRFMIPGKYTITFTKDPGSGTVRFQSVVLMAGKEQLAELKNPAVEAQSAVFEFDLKRSMRGKITAMVVKGESDAAGSDSSGRIVIERQVLRPRKEVK